MKNQSKKETSFLKQSFTAALCAAENSPRSEEAWEHLEEIADKLQRPDKIAELYLKVLDRKLPKDVIARISRRAANFYKEWFNDNPEAIFNLFSRIIEIDPDAEWAFERLTVLLTEAEKWDKLLSVYDAFLGSTQDEGRRRRLLDDAALIAKDFANQPDRAVDYLKQLLAMDPEKDHLFSMLERLFEQQGRWQELIELLRSRIHRLSVGEVSAIRLRISACFLDRIDDPARALEELQALIVPNPGHAGGLELIERILALETAPSGIRRSALALLRTSYDTIKQPEDVVRVLESGLEFADPHDWVSLHREAGGRLTSLGRYVEAIEHYAVMLRKHPNDIDVRKQLSHLARRSGRHDLRVRALSEAADACTDETQQVTLFMEVAQIHRDLLNDSAAAIDMYRRVIESANAGHSDILAAAYALDSLLADAGRSQERLALLEKLASLERTPSIRRSILGDTARLARQLGDTDRALAAWNKRLEADMNDLEALEAVIDLYGGAERWDDLIESLRKRAGAGVLPQQQRRADLIRIAEVWSGELNNTSEAIDTWMQVRKEFGGDAETIEALYKLMTSAARWSELAEVLEESEQQERGRVGRLLGRLGDVLHLHVNQSQKAARFYLDALGMNPADTTAREGLLSLLAIEECGLQAAEALAKAYAATDDWEATLKLLEPRLAVSTKTDSRVMILREAAFLQEKRAKDPPAAMCLLGRAFCLVPADLTLEGEFVRLSRITGDWPAAAGIYHDAAKRIKNNPERAAQLHLAEGRILDRELNDAAGALAAYEAVIDLDPKRVDILKHAACTAARAGQWNNAARAAVALTETCNFIDKDVLDVFESEADKASAWDQLASELSRGISERSELLRSDLMREYEQRIAIWHRDRRQHFSAAETAARRAVAHGAVNLESLRLLADLQRHNPGPMLVETLLKIDTLTNRSLDALREAAEVALNLTGELELAHLTLQRLYLRSANLWCSSQEVEGESTAESSAAWALEQLVRIYREDGDIQRAVQLLISGAKLSFNPSKLRDMRRLTSEMLFEKGDRICTIQLYHEMLGETPDDLEMVRLAASLCEQEDLIAELLQLRLRELDLTDDLDKKIDLRFNISRLTGRLEERGGRIDHLLANLDDRPGHSASLDEIYQVLFRRGHCAELADVLSRQAAKIEELDDPSYAAELWAKVAKLAEENLHDTPRAVAAHKRVVDLSCTNEALDSLVRLHIERSETAEAARWLERRLEESAQKERVPILLKLARVCILMEQKDRAVAWLENAFEEAPRNTEVRKLLFEIYRSQKAWKPLARILTISALHGNDKKTVLAYALEAYDIYRNRLGSPEESVDVLEKALSLAPEDNDLKSKLCEMYYAAERFEEARQLNTELIKGFGRRFCPQRAGIHLRLARVAHAQDDTGEALHQIELAARMDHNNVSVLKTMAELARETGNLEREEFAYRTLLMAVRRHKGDWTDGNEIGPSEVLFELSRVAADRGQDEQAAELVESVIGTLAENDFSAHRLQARLYEYGEFELLKRVLTARLSYVASPRGRCEILSELADVLDGQLNRAEEALDVRLRAIESDPTFPLQHEAARGLALRLNQLERYISTVESLLNTVRRGSDSHTRCELLLRLGELMEKDRNDLNRAAKLYAQAEETGVREVDVWRAAARVAGALGNTEKQIRLLNNLTSIGEDQVETRVSAHYSLAEVQLAREDTLERGLETLSKALENEPRYERAGVIMGRASEIHRQNEDILAFYERVARKSGDERILLHYMERRVAQPGGTLEEAREAANLALKFEEWDRAETLMLRAIEIGQSMPDYPERVEWALLALAERCKQVGDLAGAVKWLSEIKETREPARLFEIVREVAELAAGPQGDLTLAARLYENLLERHTASRDIWEPLVDIYIKLGDIDRLDCFVNETLDSLQDMADRNTIRLKLAGVLLNTKGRESDAVEVLRNTYSEDPEHGETKALLVDCFERSGRWEDLIELLQNDLMVSQGRGDVQAIKSISLRLGKVLRDRDRREDAVSTYRSVFEWVSDDREILEALLGSLGPDHDQQERAELMEKLLSVEEGDSASSLAIKLESLYKSLGDSEGALRALDIGRRGAPGSSELFSRMEKIYRERGDYAKLACMLAEASEMKGDTQTKVELLLEAAAIRKESLKDPAGALEVLKQAAGLAPDDISISVELAACMKEVGECHQAIDIISSILCSEPADDGLRLRLLRMRAEMRSIVGDEAGKLKDIKEAFTLDASLAPSFKEALLEARENAAQKDDLNAERGLMLNLVDLNLSLGKRAEARELLSGWIDNNTMDVNVMYKMRVLDREDDNWEGLAKTCAILAVIEEGENQVKSILQMSHADWKLDSPADAIEGLESVLSSQPGNRKIRNELRKIYKAVGAHKKLANQLMEDAVETSDAAEEVKLLRQAVELLTECGEISEAIPIFQKILAFDPGDSRAIVALADAYIGGGKLDEAEELLDGVIAEQKENRSLDLCLFRHRKSRIAGARNDLDAQYALLQQVFKTDRNNGHVLAELADVAEKLEDWDVALSILRRITLITEECPVSRLQAYLRLGRIAERFGDRQRALFWINKARKKYPESPEVAELLKRIE